MMLVYKIDNLFENQCYNCIKRDVLCHLDKIKRDALD